MYVRMYLCIMIPTTAIISLYSMTDSSLQFMQYVFYKYLLVCARYFRRSLP